MLILALFNRFTAICVSRGMIFDMRRFDIRHEEEDDGRGQLSFGMRKVVIR